MVTEIFAWNLIHRIFVFTVKPSWFSNSPHSVWYCKVSSTWDYLSIWGIYKLSTWDTPDIKTLGQCTLSICKWQVSRVFLKQVLWSLWFYGWHTSPWAKRGLFPLFQPKACTYALWCIWVRLNAAVSSAHKSRDYYLRPLQISQF